MAAVRIVVLLVAASFVCVALRANRPEMAVAVSVAAGVAALLLSLEDIRTAAGLVGDLAARAEFAPEGLSLLLRAAGLSLLAEFGAAICRDSGEVALAVRIEVAARLALVALAAPLLLEVVQRVLSLL